MVKRTVLITLSAVVTAAGVLFPSFWFLSCLGIIPMIAISLEKHSHRDRVILGWVFGVAYTLTASFCMFWPTLPLDWIGISNIWIAGLLIGFIWLSLAVIVGSPFMLLGLLMEYVPVRALHRILFVASTWTLVQYLQIWCYALATLAGSSVFGAQISSLMVGYSLASFSPLLQLAPLGGVYALTFVAIALGVLAYEGFSRVETRSYQLVTMLTVLVSLSLVTALDHRYFLAANLNTHEPVGTARLALLSTAFKTPPRTVAEQQQVSLRQVQALREWQKPETLPLAVILPEDSAVLAHSALDARTFGMEVFGTTSVGLIDSAASTTAGTKYVRMTTYGPGGELLGTYDKIFLIAFGEYIPWMYSSLLWILHNDALNEAVASRAVDNGEVLSVVSMGAARFGSLFCMEIMSPDLYRRLTLSGANVLTNSLSQSWFHGSMIMDRYTIALAKVRAAENARYLVIAGNEFRSTVVSDQGRVLARDPGEGFSVMSADVELYDVKTPYVVLGDAVLFMPLIMILGYLAARKRH